MLCYFHSKVPSALHCFLLVIVLGLSCKSTVVCYNILPRTSFHHLLEPSISWDFFTSFANCVTSSVKWKKNKSVLSWLNIYYQWFLNFKLSTMTVAHHISFVILCLMTTCTLFFRFLFEGQHGNVLYTGTSSCVRLYDQLNLVQFSDLIGNSRLRCRLWLPWCIDFNTNYG